jgi:pimeloyl-ACP methyl ester carboxylesterase
MTIAAPIYSADVGLTTCTEISSMAPTSGVTQDPTLHERRAFERLCGLAYWPEHLSDELDDQMTIYGESYRFTLIPLAWGVVALGCVPENPRSPKPPVLVFPGTSSSVERGLFGATILADLDPLGPGYSLARDSESIIRDWLESVRRPGQRPAICVGHSLGGALAVQAAVRCPDLVARAVTFNAPMTARAVAQRWRETPADARADIFHYFRKGDPIARLGPEAIGSSYEVDVPGQHNSRLFKDKKCEPVMVETTRQTSSWWKVGLQFIALSLAFLTLGSLLLMLRFFSCGLIGGLDLSKDVPIFRNPAGKSERSEHARGWAHESLAFERLSRATGMPARSIWVSQ